MENTTFKKIFESCNESKNKPFDADLAIAMLFHKLKRKDYSIVETFRDYLHSLDDNQLISILDQIEKKYNLS